MELSTLVPGIQTNSYYMSTFNKIDLFKEVLLEIYLRNNLLYLQVRIGENTLFATSSESFQGRLASIETVKENSGVFVLQSKYHGIHFNIHGVSNINITKE